MGTTAKGYPYPEGTDLVVDGDDAIQALAEAIDTKLPYAITSGLASIALASSVGDTVVATFPADTFTAIPRVVATAENSLYNASVRNVVATSVRISVRHVDQSNASTTVPVDWIAVQQSEAVALSRGAGPEAAAPDVTVTCPTIRCSNEGIAIPINSIYVDDEGNTQTVDQVQCGVCGTDLTDTMQPIEAG